MSHELLLAKIAHGFDHLDADGDGRLTEHDHRVMGESVAMSLGHPVGSAETLQIIAAYLAIWQDLHLVALPPGTEAITREQFTASTASLADDPAAAERMLGALADAFLAITDTDGSGTVDPGEFFTFQRGHFPSLTRQAAEAAFARLDRNGDGQLSAEEFRTAIVEFWTSRDPAAPGNWWTGTPLGQL
jgi:Ca2+-binding EF-hand superfamily protein